MAMCTPETDPSISSSRVKSKESCSSRVALEGNHPGGITRGAGLKAQLRLNGGDSANFLPIDSGP